MVDYTLDINMKSQVDVPRKTYHSIADARKGAINVLKKNGNISYILYVYIYSWDGPEFGRVKHEVETLYENHGEYYTHRRANNGKCRVSPKTGRLLDYNKYWKYI